MTALPALLTEADAAVYLGLAPATLARKRRAGEIAFVKGRPARYMEAHLIDYLERQTCEAKTLKEKAPEPESPPPESSKSAPTGSVVSLDQKRGTATGTTKKPNGSSDVAWRRRMSKKRKSFLSSTTSPATGPGTQSPQRSKS